MSFVWFTSETRAAYSTPAATAIPTSVIPTLASHRVGATSGEDQGHPPQKGAHEKINPYRKEAEHNIPTREKAICAQQIMTRTVKTLPPDAAFEEAWKLFKETRLRHIPVVTPELRPIGMLSDRDVLREAPIAEKTRAQASLLVKNFMQHKILTAAPTTEIRDIARVMVVEHIGAIPIVENERVIGIVSRSDILRTLMNNVPLELWI